MEADSDIDKEIDAVLFKVEADRLKLKDPTGAYLEQYKLFLDHMDKLADRRQTANSFFLTLNTGLCATLAFLCSKETLKEIGRLAFIVPLAGVMLSVFWHQLVASYSQLNTGKFKIIHRLERHLPVGLYEAEWVALGRGKNPDTYRPLTHVEVWVPKVFMGMYGLIMLCLIPWGRICGFLAKWNCCVSSP